MSTSPVSLAAPPDLIELGQVSGSYGVRGWLKVEPFSAQSPVLLQARQWWVRLGEQGPLVCWQVLQSRTQGAAVVAHVQGFSQPEQVRVWKGARVLVSRQAFPEPNEDEYYWADLLGCHVYGQDDAAGPEGNPLRPSADASVYLGQVLHMSDNGAHGVMHVRRYASPQAAEPLLDTRGREQVVLVPFVAAHVLSVNLGSRQILTNWPPDV